MREPVDHKLAAILGGAARVARLRLGLTQSDVAERVGMAMEVYSRLERGRMLPRTQTLKRLCDVLQVSSDTLLGVGRGGASVTPVTPRKPEREDSLELRRMTRKLRELPPSQLRAVSRVVNAVVSVMPPAAPSKPVRAVKRRKAG